MTVIDSSGGTLMINGYECHPIYHHTPVIALYPGSPMREVYAQWWRPARFTPAYWQDTSWLIRPGAPPRPTREDVTQFALFLRDHGIECHSWHMALKMGLQGKLLYEPVKKPVLLRISQMLRKPIERVFNLNLHRVGEVLGYAYDLYAETMSEPSVLRGGEAASNRCREMDFVWWRAMRDLVFTTINFKPADPEDEDIFLAEIEFGMTS